MRKWNVDYVADWCPARAAFPSAQIIKNVVRQATNSPTLKHFPIIWLQFIPGPTVSSPPSHTPTVNFDGTFLCRKFRIIKNNIESNKQHSAFTRITPKLWTFSMNLWSFQFAFIADAIQMIHKASRYKKCQINGMNGHSQFPSIMSYHRRTTARKCIVCDPFLGDAMLTITPFSNQCVSKGMQMNWASRRLRRFDCAPNTQPKR